MHIDLNSDLGEGIGNDAAIMPFISSANIACGYHAGDEITIEATIDLCIQFNVAVGAHPSFPDRQNFGRSEMHFTTGEVYEIVTEQLGIISAITTAKGVSLHHVKPHGALYNQSAKSISIARTIAQAVKDFDRDLIIYGLSGSHSIYEARALGLKTASEVFADRTYQDDGSLTLRSQPEALIQDVRAAVRQAIHLVEDGCVKTISGREILLVADTICIHGDSPNAKELAEEIYKALNNREITIVGCEPLSHKDTK